MKACCRLAWIIYVGRNKVAQSVAGTAQTLSTDVSHCLLSTRRKATEVPAEEAFARSGLHIYE
jgi:hypothetical protein